MTVVDSRVPNKLPVVLCNVNLSSKDITIPCYIKLKLFIEMHNTKLYLLIMQSLAHITID